MKLRKRLSALIVSAALLLTALPAIAPATASAATTMGSIVLTIDSPTMTVNGTSKAIDAEGSKPALDAGGYTMLPLRGVVEAMGGSLTWDAANRIVTMVKDGQTIKVPIGSTKLTVDGVQKDMLANNGTYKAAYINKSGRTLVHVRALQAFNNTTCTWNQATKQVTVTYPTNTPVVSSKNYRVDLINQTGADINALYYRSGPNGTYGKNVLTTAIKKNSTGSIYISVPDNAVSRVYDFYTEGSGTNVYSGINLTGANAYVTVLLKENGKFEQANDKTITVSSGNTALKVENNSKLDIEKLYMSKDSSFSSSEIIWDKTIDAGDDETIDIDLDGTKTWYFQAVDEDGDKYKSGKVTFSSSTVKSATLTFSSSKKLSLKGSSSDGDITVAIVNDTETKIRKAYLVDKGDGRNFDIDKYDKDDDILDDNSGLKAGEYIVLEDIAEADKYDIVLYYGSGDNDFDYFSVNLEDADTYALIYVNDDSRDRFSGSVYTDNDDEMIVGVYNGTDKDLSNVKVRAQDKDATRIKDIGSLKDEYIYFVEVNTDDDPDININWSGNPSGIDIDDLDEENPFAVITLKDKDDYSLDSIDDI